VIRAAVGLSAQSPRLGSGWVVAMRRGVTAEQHLDALRLGILGPFVAR
jgi:hypothetical protein